MYCNILKQHIQTQKLQHIRCEVIFLSTSNPTFVVGDDSTPQLEYGRAVVEGSITSYWEDLSLVNRFLNETETAFSVAVNDPTGSNEYKFFFPRVKFNGATIPVDNPQSRIITIPFVALYDTTENSNLVIYRPETA